MKDIINIAINGLTLVAISNAGTWSAAIVILAIATVAKAANDA